MARTGWRRPALAGGAFAVSPSPSANGFLSGSADHVGYR